MGAKLFEAEVGRTLNALPDSFWLKPLDGVMWAAERVDFHGIYHGRAVNVECKEVKSVDRFNITTQVSANQLACLRATEAAGGLGLLLVNYGRLRGATAADRSRGFMAVYRYADLEGTILTPEMAFVSVFPKPGGTWEIGWLEQLALSFSTGPTRHDKEVLLPDPARRGHIKAWR